MYAQRNLLRRPIRRAFLAVAAFASGVMLLPDRPEFIRTATAQTPAPAVNVSPATSDRPASLRDRLIVGLRAMSKSDIAFVDSVVARVQAGQLPQRLVDQTFFWARDRAARTQGGRTRRPIIYFQPALTAQAKRLGVTL
ncbi:MAG: hypothetical protein WD669_07180 [Pirellulales bacterium]